MSSLSPPPQDSPEVLARIHEGLEVVEMLARQLRRQCGPHVQLDDLVSQGRETLVATARSFDPERGVPFRKWANLRIRGAMIDAIRSQGNLPRTVYRKLRALQAADRVHATAVEERPSADALSPDEAATKVSEQLGSAAMAMAIGFLSMRADEALEEAVDANGSPEDLVGRTELLAQLREAIARRPDAERLLLERHYFEDVAFEETARELGLSKSWASRLHSRAIEALAKEFRREGPPR